MILFLFTRAVQGSQRRRRWLVPFGRRYRREGILIVFIIGRSQIRLQESYSSAPLGGERSGEDARSHDRIGFRGAPVPDSQLLLQPEALQARHTQVSVGAKKNESAIFSVSKRRDACSVGGRHDSKVMLCTSGFLFLVVSSRGLFFYTYLPLSKMAHGFYGLAQRQPSKMRFRKVPINRNICSFKA